MKVCRVCQKEFDPRQKSEDPAQQAGDFFAREIWQDEGELCPGCLTSRGVLGMMYCQEFD